MTEDRKYMEISVPSFSCYEPKIALENKNLILKTTINENEKV